jgi:hypothetical protein
MKPILTLLLAYVLNCLTVNSLAQTTDLIKYDLMSGLPGLQVTCLFEDSKGYLWVGTKSGLSCFDGIRFENFTEKEGIPANYIIDFTETTEGVWALTNKGLVLFRHNSFTNYTIPLKTGEYLDRYIIKHTNEAFIIHIINTLTNTTQLFYFDLSKKEYKPFEVASNINGFVGKVEENAYLAEVLISENGCIRTYVCYN